MDVRSVAELFMLMYGLLEHSILFLEAASHHFELNLSKNGQKGPNSQCFDL